MSKEKRPPYEVLGKRLKFLREQWQQSRREVSGTLEIDERSLKDIEEGKSLPRPELLDMFISHFLLTEDQAEDLRTLAEDQFSLNNDALASGLEDMLMKQIVMFLPVDNKVVYTDSMHATVNDHGVILQFMQQTSNGQSAPISRVGMSREHAEKVIEVLKSTLKQHDQGKHKRMLPGKSNETSSSS